MFVFVTLLIFVYKVLTIEDFLRKIWLEGINQSADPIENPIGSEKRLYFIDKRTYPQSNA